MEGLKVFGIVFFICIVIFYPAFSFLNYLELYESFHPDYESFHEARVHGTLDQMLPETANSIHQRHHIDLNKIWFCFSLEEEEKEDFLQQLNSGKDISTQFWLESPYQMFFDAFQFVEWWPEWLQKDAFPWTEIEEGVNFYSYSGDKGYKIFTLATKEGSQRICGWSVD